MTERYRHAWINGKVVPLSRASVPLTDSGYLHGDGLFETLRVYEGTPVFLEDHLARMTRSARAMGVEATKLLRMVPKGAEKLVRRTEAVDAALRINLTWEGGLLSRPGTAPRLTMLLRSYIPPSEADRVSGVALLLWPWPRAAGNPLYRHKSLSYSENMAARRMAQDAGAFDTLFVNTRGHVTEGTATNVFAVVAGRLYTPPLAEGLLPGVTRAHILGLCRRLGIRARQWPLTVEHMLRADEVFVANSLAEVVPVTRIGRSRAGGGKPGPITSRLARAYREEVEGAVRGTHRE